MCEIEKAIVGVLSEVLNVPSERISRIDNFVDIDNWDSLHHLNVVGDIINLPEQQNQPLVSNTESWCLQMTGTTPQLLYSRL